MNDPPVANRHRVRRGTVRGQRSRRRQCAFVL